MPLPLDRRTFLRSAGVCIGLPLLDAMLPIGLRAEQKAAAMRPRRMLLIGRPLGLHAPFFFPEKAGKDYEPTPLPASRCRTTAGTSPSSPACRTAAIPAATTPRSALLTGVAPEGIRLNDIRNTISLDQEVPRASAARRASPPCRSAAATLSWNRKGVQVPSEARATQVFKQLFIDGTPEEVAREVERIETARASSTACATRPDARPNRSARPTASAWTCC